MKYEEAQKQLREHRIELSNFLTEERFNEALRRATAGCTRPVVMLCNDPECSKLKPRLEFLGKDRIEFKRKDKTVMTVASPLAAKKGVKPCM